MKFLNNSTDRLMIEYLAKSMPFTDLCKAVGKIPIKKLVYQDGKKPFIETFYVSPEEAKNLHLKAGSLSHDYKIADHPSMSESKFHIATDVDNLIDGNTKIKGTLNSDIKSAIQDSIHSSVVSLSQNMESMYKYRKKFNKPQIMHVPQNLKLTPHIESLDVDDESMKLKWKTNISYTDFDEDLFQQFLDGLTGVEFDRKRGLFEVDENNNLVFYSTSPVNLMKYTEDRKNELYHQMMDDFEKQMDILADSTLDNYDDPKISRETQSENEEKIFKSILDGASKKQLSRYRTTGIGCDPSDSSANNFIEHICRNYLRVEFGLVKEKARFIGANWTFKEVRDLMKSYAEEVANAPDKIKLENNELKCRIKSVDESTYSKISQKIIDDWDNRVHGGFKPKIKGIYEITDIPAREKFEKIVELNKDCFTEEEDPLEVNCQRDTFYHGTDSTATALILGHSGKFKIKKAKTGSMFGEGIYLASESSKSAQYIGDKFGRKAGTEGTLMICEASLGNCAYIESSYEYEKFFDSEEYDEEYDPDNYDTIAAYGGGVVKNNEWCVHDPDAICPKYAIYMELVKNEEE